MEQALGDGEVATETATVTGLWMFLRNPTDGIAAMDLFVLPTISSGLW